MPKKLQRLLIVIAVILVLTVGLQQLGRIMLPGWTYDYQWVAGVGIVLTLVISFLLISLIIEYINNGD